MNYKIYIVEDDLSIGGLLKDYITKYGFDVKVEERIVELEGLKLYTERPGIEFKDKKLIITKKEGILLEYLMKKYPKVVNRDFLLDKIWDNIDFVEENTLNVNVSRIRKRLQELGIDNGIETVRRLGYRLNKTW